MYWQVAGSVRESPKYKEQNPKLFLIADINFSCGLYFFLFLIKRPSTLPKQADGLTLKQPVAKIK